MSIQTEHIIGDDGKPMTPEQIKISRLTKSNAALTEKYTNLEKRVDALEAAVLRIEETEKRRPRF